MAKRYIRLNWQDKPNTATPISAANLNKMDKGIDDIDKALDALETSIVGQIVNDPSKINNAAVIFSLKQSLDALNNNLALVSGGSYAADANTITPLVLQVIPYNASTLNTPYKAGITAKQGGIIFSFCTSANYGIQLALPISDKQIFMRGLEAGVWGIWEIKIN